MVSRGQPAEIGSQPFQGFGGGEGIAPQEVATVFHGSVHPCRETDLGRGSDHCVEVDVDRAGDGQVEDRPDRIGMADQPGQLRQLAAAVPQQKVEDGRAITTGDIVFHADRPMPGIKRLRLADKRLGSKDNLVAE